MSKTDKFYETNKDLIKQIYDSIDGEPGVLADKNSDVFNKNLPEGHTPESVETLTNYVRRYAPCARAAIGMKATEQMASNKDLSSVVGTVSMGSMGSVTVDVDRSREVTPPPKEGEEAKTIEVKGSTRVKVTFDGGEKSSDMKYAGRWVRDLADKAY